MTSTTVAAEQAALAAQRERFNATIERDIEALERLVADDLTYVHTSAGTDTKTSMLESIRSERLRYHAFDCSEVTARAFGEAVVITGRADLTMGADADRILRIRFLDVWALRDGAWREVAWQSTRLPDPPSS